MQLQVVQCWEFQELDTMRNTNRRSRASALKTGKSKFFIALALFGGVAISAAYGDGTGPFHRIQYNNPGLVVDLGVGLWAWPLPMDYDGDGDLDLVVSCPDIPSNGTYFFENPGGDARFPVFRPGVRIDRGFENVQVSYVEGQSRVLSPGIEYTDFRQHQFAQEQQLPCAKQFHAQAEIPNQQGDIRANQWKYVDYDDDGRLDVIIGIGEWADYGWDNAYNETGEWTHGPLHGYVYLVRNTGSTEQPNYAKPVKLTAAGEPIDVYGMPSPNLADFDGDGDLDLLCGEFVDKFTYFENTGTRREPRFRKGRYLEHNDRPLQADLCMIVPVAIDWDRDGDIDLVVGQEDGRVMLIEHSGQVTGGLPRFKPPQFFRQQAAELKFGALATPSSCDWDGDGDEDLLCGNTAGEIGFLENLDGGNPPKWAAPQRLEAAGQVIRIQAGKNGSIQGPCEAKWGYTTPSAADWDHDGLPDLVVNSIWGKVLWFKNIGSRRAPRLAAAQPIEVAWIGETPKPAWNWWDPIGKSLATHWRTTPVVIDFNDDGLNDLVMLDREGYLAFFERSRQNKQLVLSPPKRIFASKDGSPLCLAGLAGGGSGRRKLCLTDWDRDGQRDLLVNSENLNFLRASGWHTGMVTLQDEGAIHTHRLAGHSTSPTTVDWDKDGVPDLLIGAEDGCFYYLENPHPLPPRPPNEL